MEIRSCEPYSFLLRQCSGVFDVTPFERSHVDQTLDVALAAVVIIERRGSAGVGDPMTNSSRRRAW